MPTFNLNSDDLQPVIDILDEALLNRPEPIGIPHYDIDSAIASAREYSDAIDELSDPDIQLDAWDLQHLAQSMANGYKEFWESPFPIGLETTQTTNKSNKSSCCGWILAAGLFGYWLGN
ncbi:MULTISPECIES: hypothetical protein [unclassified Lonepinella]|uniref:hypothetical protein n=1 Tax=unclassified Lonepinella TaxID=2642006 RepID=UPI0036D96B5A